MEREFVKQKLSEILQQKTPVPETEKSDIAPKSSGAFRALRLFLLTLLIILTLSVSQVQASKHTQTAQIPEFPDLEIQKAVLSDPTRKLTIINYHHVGCSFIRPSSPINPLAGKRPLNI
ncbi:MAG: hypothetical protein ACOWWM_19390 [Desulfobacterales bacterium]